MNNSKKWSLGTLMVWVAGFAAVAGLVEEVTRKAVIEGSTASTGFMLIFYVFYISISIRSFWKLPLVAIPTMLVISGVLWTLVLQFLEWMNLPVAIAIFVAVPIATSFAIRRIFRASLASPEPEEPGSTSVGKLLERGQGLGSRSTLTDQPPS